MSEVRGEAVGEDVLDDWWGHRDIWEVEKISGYSRDAFFGDKIFDSFADCCDEWWFGLSVEEKRGFYVEYGEAA